MTASYSSQNSPHYNERDVVPEWPRRSRPPAQRDEQATPKKRSLGRRMLRGFFRLAFAILLGVAGTLAWQSHGEQAKTTIRIWAPSLGWLLPVSTASPLDSQASAATAVTSADLAQQIKPVALDLAIVRHGVDQLATTIKQLAAKQDEMAQEIATLQATGQDLKEKASALAQTRPTGTRKTSQSTGQSSAAQPPSGAPMRLLDNSAQSTR
jgi:outer membrane murein-binding lipoprotein Lpp